MRIEVEQKFPVTDLAVIEQTIRAMGVDISEVIVEADQYYAHPCRDFAQTDEALRIRRSNAKGWLTYKGPKLDAQTKSRREVDLPLPSGAADDWASLIELLGFRPVAEVRKRRRKAIVPWEGRSVEMSLDDVDRAGTFVELELIASDEDLESAKSCIARLAAQLRLSSSERRSYLELLLIAAAASRESTS